MKTNTKHLSILLLTIITITTLMVPGIGMAQTPTQVPAPAAAVDNTATKPVDNTAPKPDVDPPAPTGPETSVVSPAEEAKILNGESVTDTSTPTEQAAAAANKTDNDACIAAAETKGMSGVTDCTTYRNALEKDCKDKTKNISPTGEQIEYTSCADKAASEKNLRGQGFKLNLNALTLTSGGQKSGSAIFENKDYKQYGPLVGTLMRVIDMLILIIGSLAMLTLIIAGIFMIANHGDEAWVTKGKTMMLYSVLGLLAAFLSFAIVNVIQSALA